VGLLDGLVDERFPARGEPRFAAKLSWQVFYGWYSGFMSFIAIGGLGYNGEISRGACFERSGR